MKIAMIALSALAVLCESASAEPQFPPHKQTFRQQVPGGTGMDFTTIQVFASSDQFYRGDYFIRFNVSGQLIVEAKIPVFRVVQECEFHRASGGSVGDYKPKNIITAVQVGYYKDFQNDIWFEDHWGEDHNDNPVVKDHDFRGLNLAGAGGTIAKREMTEECIRSIVPGGHHDIAIRWSTSGYCRWKPENWNKPANFPLEYHQGNNSTETRIRLYCE